MCLGGAFLGGGGGDFFTTFFFFFLPGVGGFWPYAVGNVPHPLGPSHAMSAFLSPSKSPATTCAPAWAAHCGKFVTGWFVTWNVPEPPLENATGMVRHPRPPTRAASSFPSPLKSADTSLALGVVAQDAKFAMGRLVTLN